MSNCVLVAARSLIALAASRLALRAPALRAATALTRPKGSAQRLPSGRHAGPTAMTVGPNKVVDYAKRKHLRNPSLLMRARAQATVRVWKKRPQLQANSRIGIRGGCGLPVATGGVSGNDPRHPSLCSFPSYNEARVHHTTWRRGSVAARGARAAGRAHAPGRRTEWPSLVVVTVITRGCRVLGTKPKSVVSGAAV
jgi:hypothetical protein